MRKAFFIKGLLLVLVLTSILVGCKTQEQRLKDEKAKLKYKIEMEKARAEYEEQKEALEARKNNFKELMKKYNTEKWQTDGTKSIEWSLREHQTAVAKDNIKEYKGSCEEAITKSQAISIAQIDAYKRYAKDMASMIETKAEESNLYKKENADNTAEANTWLKEELQQNAIAVTGGFLEKAYIFVKRDENNRWWADVAYLYDKNQDLKAMKKVLLQTVQNTKLWTEEKMWLKKLNEELNK